MITRQHVEPNFFDGAEEARTILDEKFNKPYQDTIAWNYFAVPQLYAYLRTSPWTVFPQALFQRFMTRLRAWTFDQLGLVPTGDPMLHLMVNGCSLSLHSDFHNGAFGYVYSLTRWSCRTFAGGETLLLRDGNTSYKKHHAHGSTLYELVPALFNQLLVFDDRIAHATPTIEGSMTPKEGRIAIVGHIRARGAKVIGPLPASAARKAISEMLARLSAQLKAFKDVQGTMSYRLRVRPDGIVGSVHVLTNNLVVPGIGYGRSEEVIASQTRLHDHLRALRFPPASDGSEVTVAVLLPIPDLRPIEVRVSHTLPSEMARSAARKAIANIGGPDARWEMQGETELVIEDPLVGVVRVGSDAIVASFEAPQWVPSQRAQFELEVTQTIQAAVEAERAALLSET